MPTLHIDNHPVTVPPGTTILDAAAQVGVTIPTLCHRPDLAQQAGCMVCVVREEASGRLLPSCATPAADGMRIATAAPEALALRRSMLELLFGNHAAECEGPCERACPAHADVPRMLDALGRGDADGALRVALERLALPATLGAICPAPCEKACRRGAHDAPVAIAAAHRWAGEHGAAVPSRAPETGKRVVIVGAGPTGLAAAFYLRLQGHTCHVIEAGTVPGALLPEQTGGRLPAEALARDVARLHALGVTWDLGRAVSATEVAALLAGCDALVVAAGGGAADLAGALGVGVEQERIVADPATRQTANPKVFAGGAAVHPCRLAARACGDGRVLALHLDAFLAGRSLAGLAPVRFQSQLGKPSAAWMADRLAAADPSARQTVPLATGSVRREAARCLRCDCLKKDACRLRSLAERSGVRAHAPTGEHALPGRVLAAPDIVFEAAKCVLCGICVRLAAKQGARCGPAFHGRGFGMRIGPPLGRTWADVPRDLLLACVAACPTGAWGRREGGIAKAEWGS